jgi:hypothetical protein
MLKGIDPDFRQDDGVGSGSRSVQDARIAHRTGGFEVARCARCPNRTPDRWFGVARCARCSKGKGRVLAEGHGNKQRNYIPIA